MPAVITSREATEGRNVSVHTADALATTPGGSQIPGPLFHVATFPGSNAVGISLPAVIRSREATEGRKI
eukprot:6192361-Pyramimonas_sp.AAC.1